MPNNLTCTQVSALLSFYIDDKLSSQLREFVKLHLGVCPVCQAKFEALKNMILSLREAHERLDSLKEEGIVCEPSLDEAIKVNLSAYIDNELSDSENIKVKKNIISNLKARDELEKMYTLKKLLHKSFEKTKNECKDDYSKLIFRRIDMQEEVYGNDSFSRVVALFLIIFAVFTLSAVLIFWV